MKRHELIVPENSAGTRIDVFLSEQESLGISRSQVKNLIEAGHVFVAGAKVSKPGAKVNAGGTVVVEIPEPKALDLTPQDLQLKIVYEDGELAVIDKPAGISVHPSETEDAPTLVHGLLHALESLSSVGGIARPGIVHRIDKGTSGLLVISKTDRAHQGLSEQFKAHTIDRRYWALVYGDLYGKKGAAGKIDTFFGRHPTHRKKMTGAVTSGRRAITHWKVIERFALPITLVECRLETGRTHQIRAHLCELGFPLVGDPVYGNHEKLAEGLKQQKGRSVENALIDSLVARLKSIDHQLLHARTLGFNHPTTGEKLEFQSSVPEDYAAVLTELR